MLDINVMFLTDSYKLMHCNMYPENTTKIYSHYIARSAKNAKKMIPEAFFDNKVVVYGVWGAIKEIHERFEAFFSMDFDIFWEKFLSSCGHFLDEKTSLHKNRFKELHSYQKIPLQIKALSEGMKIPIGVPFLTITNTDKRFFWLVNYVETLLSSLVWKSMTVATIAYEYRKILEFYAEKTGGDLAFVDFQLHDFSARGLSGIEDSARSGSGHLTSFIGTDNIPSVEYMKLYYKGKEPGLSASVFATEHSVMCMHEDEFELYHKLITKIHPNGILSIVSDTYDFWRVVEEYLPKLKNDILARGEDRFGLSKVVIRPDSGDPKKIICGDENAQGAEKTGLIESLWNVFGGTINKKGYKVLNPKIGAIYGDSITPIVANDILNSLEKKGFCSTNIVFGVGSFSYQYHTRDTFGFAIKASYAEINGVGRSIFKNPKTDSGKKSPKGLLKVFVNSKGEYEMAEDVTLEEEKSGELVDILNDGVLSDGANIFEIRDRLRKNTQTA